MSRGVEVSTILLAGCNIFSRDPLVDKPSFMLIIIIYIKQLLKKKRLKYFYKFVQREGKGCQVVGMLPGVIKFGLWCLNMHSRRDMTISAQEWQWMDMNIAEMSSAPSLNLKIVCLSVSARTFITYAMSYIKDIQSNGRTNGHLCPCRTLRTQSQQTDKQTVS